jgi:hypothetical protein
MPSKPMTVMIPEPLKRGGFCRQNCPLMVRDGYARFCNFMDKEWERPGPACPQHRQERQENTIAESQNGGRLA